MKIMLQVILLVVVFAGISNAQISITSADIQSRLAVGKEYNTIWDTTTTTIDLGAKGQSTWDFSNLKNDHEFKTTSVAVASTPYAADFAGAQFAHHYADTFNGVYSESYVYTSAGADYLFHGTGTQSNPSGLNMVVKIQNDPAQIFYQLPMTYNSTNTQTVSQKITSTTTVFGYTTTTTLTNSVKESYVVDGYGYMKTPDGKTLECLRVTSTSEVTTEQGTTSISTNINFIAKTGETVGITLKDGQPDIGVVLTDNITYSTGDGVSTTPTSAKNAGELPVGFVLNQNFPNPFNPTTRISFSIPQQSFVSLKVFDITGREIAELINRELNAGSYTSDFNAANLSSGIYLYSLKTSGFTQTRKMLLIK
jgi:hypothetical protein